MGRNQRISLIREEFGEVPRIVATEPVWTGWIGSSFLKNPSCPSYSASVRLRPDAANWMDGRGSSSLVRTSGLPQQFRSRQGLVQFARNGGR